ncbi:MAG: hypothetical protein LBR17_04270 [Bacteroidales bacterium]|jgi:hypothetical protein|nr:hypothetical protein [Bacteroidales bacterium]
MKQKQPLYHFKCGILMKIVLSVSLLSAVIFAIFNLYVVIFANDILKSPSDTSGLLSKLIFIREKVVLNLTNDGKILYLLSFLFSLTLIFGVWRMWKGRIWGLLFYFVSKSALVLMPLLLLRGGYAGSGDIMFALFFICFYSIYIYQHKYKLNAI